MPISVAERSKARVCGRSPAEIAGSNPAGGMMFMFCVLYSKGKKQSHDIQDKEVRTKYKARTKKEPPGSWMSVL